MGLRLYVRSEYRLDGVFERNIFFVEGKSGLKYKCGVSGALPPSLAGAAAYPKAALENIPRLVERQRKKLAELENEQPVLQQMLGRRWGKEDELKRLKLECKELQEKIDRSLKEAEQPVMAEPVSVPDYAA